MNEFLKRKIIPFYSAKKTIDNIKLFGLIDGIRIDMNDYAFDAEMFRDDCKYFIDDRIDDLKDLPKKAPLLKEIYQEGIYEGKKKGYEKASLEYEKKLLEQSKEFLNQSKILEKDINERNSLLSEYELYIEKRELEFKKLNEQQLEMLKKLKKQYNELLKMHLNYD